VRQRIFRETLLATSSALAIITAAGQSAYAQCAINNSFPANNAGAINCISYNNNVNNTGDVVNQGGGTITPTHAYAPTLPGTATGISVVGLGTTLTGNITNSGTITNTLGNWGINIGSGAYNGGLISSNGAVLNGSITNNGTITAPTGISVQASSVSGAIINALGALIQGTSHVGISVSNGATVGSITNSGTITEKTGVGINVSLGNVTGSVSNAGTITTTGFSAIGIVNGNGTIGGSVINSGTLTDNNPGDNIGIYIGGYSIGGSVINTAGATINGAYGIAITGSNVSGHQAIVTGNVSNAGTITARTKDGIALFNTTVGGSVLNVGTITALDRIGIRLVDTSGVVGAATVTGSISNSGTINAKTGIVVSGLAVAGGGITNSGTLTGSTAAIDVTGEGAATTIDQTAGTITGAILLSSLGDTVNVSGGTINGNITGTGPSGTVNFALGAGTFTYTNTISGVSAVNVNSGTLYDNNSITATTTTVLNSAKLSAGTPGTPGTLAITGNLAFQSGAIYLTQVTPATASRINVSGTATLTGASVNAVFGPGSYTSKQYEILQSSGLVGTFTGVTGTPPGGVSESLGYVGNDVFLNLTANLGGGNTPLSGNQQAVANALNNFFNSGGVLPPNFADIFNLTGSQLAQALSQLDGEAATGAATNTFQLFDDLLTLLSDIAQGTGGGSGAGGGAQGFAAEPDDAFPPDLALAYNKLLKKPSPAAPQTFEQRWTAWGSGFGGTASYNGNATIGSSNVTASDFGFAGGMDYHAAADLKVGFALAGAGTNWSLAQNLGGGRSDVFQIAGYAIKHYGPLYFTGMAAFGNSWFTTNRIAALGDQLTAKFAGQSYALRGEIGYRYALLPAAGMTPYAALQTQWFHTPSYSETDLTGGGFALAYNAQTVNDTRSELGARADDLATLGGMPLLLQGRLAWAHDWVSSPALGAVFQALPGAAFTVNGAAVPKDSALASAGGQLFLTPNWSVEAKFNGEFASTAQTYAGSGTVRYTW
jgi:uncharacterized protein with beta-barrel porin domain